MSPSDTWSQLFSGAPARRCFCPREKRLRLHPGTLGLGKAVKVHLEPALLFCDGDSEMRIVPSLAPPVLSGLNAAHICV